MKRRKIFVGDESQYYAHISDDLVKLYHSNEECWTPHTRATLAATVRNSGNDITVIIPGLKIVLDYGDAERIQIALALAFPIQFTQYRKVK